MKSVATSSSLVVLSRLFLYTVQGTRIDLTLDVQESGGRWGFNGDHQIGPEPAEPTRVAFEIVLADAKSAASSDKVLAALWKECKAAGICHGIALAEALLRASADLPAELKAMGIICLGATQMKTPGEQFGDFNVPVLTHVPPASSPVIARMGWSEHGGGESSRGYFSPGRYVVPVPLSRVRACR